MTQIQRLTSRGSLRVALFGIWGTLEAFLYELHTSSVESDVLAARSLVSDAPGSPQGSGAAVFKDYLTNQRVLGLTSMRAIHQRCLETARTNIARALLIMGMDVKLNSCLNSFRVDEIRVRVPPRKRDQIKQALEAVKYSDLHTIVPPFKNRSTRRPRAPLPRSSKPNG
jgi:hypothetical protein